MTDSVIRDTIEAKRFILKDEQGQLRAELGMVGGGPVLGLYGTNGARRAQLALTGDQGFLTLRDAGGQSRAVLSAIGDKPGLSLFDANKRVRATFGLFDQGLTLDLRDADGQSRAMLTLSDIGPRLTLYDADGRLRACLSVLTDKEVLNLEAQPTLKGHRVPTASLILFDKDGDALWRAP